MRRYIYCVMKEIGQRLKELRTTQGYTQKQVADYLGIDQSNYSKMEHGKRKLTKLSMLQKLCTLYQCTQEHILYGTEEHTHQEWTGTDKNTDLNIIAQANTTMNHLKMLRGIQKRRTRQ